MNIKYFVVVAVLLTVFFGFSGTVNAITVQELQDMIANLQKQIAQLQEQLKQAQGQGSTAKWCYNFTKNLRIGDNNIDVEQLVGALVKEEVFSTAKGSYYDFDEQLASAVSEFQEKYADEILKPNGLRKGNGYVGPATRKKLNTLYGCSVVVVPPPVACTQDAKQCPDGSYVSRTGPKCEFAKCPETRAQCKVDADCPQIACVVGPCPINKCTNGKCVLTDVSIKEQVKCIFENNAEGSLQKCYTAESNSRAFCSGVETCVADISGTRGEKITWKSSCGGYAYTTIDGQNEYATFDCTSTTQPSITVTSPNGGEQWQTGSTQTIKWTTNNIPASSEMTVRLRSDLGKEYYFYGTSTVSNTVPNNGFFSVTISSTIPAGKYKAEVKTSVNGQSYLDESDNYFTIISNQIACTDSDGGENYFVN